MAITGYYITPSVHIVREYIFAAVVNFRLFKAIEAWAWHIP